MVVVLLAHGVRAVEVPPPDVPLNVRALVRLRAATSPRALVDDPGGLRPVLAVVQEERRRGGGGRRRRGGRRGGGRR